VPFNWKVVTCCQSFKLEGMKNKCEHHILRFLVLERMFSLLCRDFIDREKGNTLLLEEQSLGIWNWWFDQVIPQCQRVLWVRQVYYLELRIFINDFGGQIGIFPWGELMWFQRQSQLYLDWSAVGRPTEHSTKLYRPLEKHLMILL
jgi:hypothetical protein